GLVYLWAGPPKLGRRVAQLAAGGVAMVAAAGWWVAAVQLTPAAERPYIGGSQNNSLFNLIFGYNGFGRITGNETGSVGGGAGGGTSMWGPTGWTRMFNSSFGTQASWLIPGALVLLAAVLFMTFGAPRRDRTRAAFLLWGGWLLVTMAVFSFAQGIIHPYYTVALAPAIGALVGMGAVHLWRRRDQWFSRIALAVSLVLTAEWALAMLDRTPTWNPWLRGVVLATGIVAALGLLAAPYVARSIRRGAVIMAVGAALGAPLAVTIDTVATPASGAIPIAGPSSAFAGPGGGAFPSGGRFGAGGGQRGGSTPPGFAGGTGTGGFAPPGFPAGTGIGRFPGGLPGATGAAGLGGLGRGRAGGAGGLLNASTPSAKLVELLQTDASKYRWVAAAIGANTAAGYQLGTDDPVMAIGGFNGTDPDPSLAAIEKLVTEHKVHYFISGGGLGGLAVRFGGGFGAFGGGSARTGTTSTVRPGGPQESQDATAITSWVESHFTAITVGGVTLYDLSASKG
ncbi:MAG: glycosyl transferase, partial [Acidimicrobiales bacterium]